MCDTTLTTHPSASSPVSCVFSCFLRYGYHQSLHSFPTRRSSDLHKTTASLMIAATLGVTRGGNVLAWDNNETRATLGWRGIPSDHNRTAVDLLQNIDQIGRAHV